MNALFEYKIKMFKVYSEAKDYIDELSEPIFQPKIIKNKANILSWKAI